MSTSNGQIADQNTFNNAYLSKQADNVAIGKTDLNNTEPASGGAITNIQKKMNDNTSASDTNATDIATNASDITANALVVTNLTTDDIAETNTRYFDIKNNHNAVVDPIVTDDANSNYVIGSKWNNTANKNIFMCVDATAGAAVWENVTNHTHSDLSHVGVDGTASDTILEVGDTSTLKADIGTGKLEVAHDGATYSEIVGTDLTQTIINKSIDGDNNTIVNLRHGSEVDNPSAGAHGVSGDILGTTDVQNVSNKAIIDPSRLDVKKDTEANLVTYALTASNGQLCFATDAKLMYQVVDNLLTEVGGGSGGGGGLDVFVAEDFEETVASSLTSGKDAIFDNAGTLGGVLSDETTTPIAGLSCIKYVTNATVGNSTGDFFYLPVYTLDEKQKGQTVGINLYFNSTISKDLMEVVVWDDTNNVKLNSSTDTIESSAINLRYSSSVYIPATCNAIKVGFHHAGVSESSKVLIFDDIQLSTNPFVYKQLVDDAIIMSASGNSGQTILNATFTTVIFPTVIEDLSGSYNNSTGVYTVKKAGVFGCQSSVEWTLGANGLTPDTGRFFSYIASTGTQLSKDKGQEAVNLIGSSYVVGYNSVFRCEIGDTIELKVWQDSNVGGADLSTSTSNNTISVIKQVSTTEHLITPAKTNLTDWVAFTPTGSWTINTTYAGEYRRVGDTAEIRITVSNSGIPDAVDLLINNPTGLIADNTKIPVSSQNVVGEAYLSNSGTLSYVGLSTYNNTTSIRVRHSEAGNFGNVNDQNPFPFNTNDRVYVSYSIPIVGWSSDLTFLAAIPINYQNVNPNILINGDGRVNQRGLLPVTGVVNGAYYLDRFLSETYLVTSDASLITTSQPASLSGSQSLRYTATSTSSTAPAYCGSMQQVEDFALYKGKTVTFSAWVKYNSVTGDTAVFQIFDGVTQTGISIPNTGNWEFVTYTKTLSSSATSLRVDIRMLVNTTGVETITSGDYIEFTGAKLELGSEATEFVADSYGDSLRKCQRYYEKGSVRWDGYVVSPTNYSAAVYYKVEKYTITTPTVTNSSVTNFNATTNVVDNTLEGFSAWHASTSTGTASFADIWIVESEL